MTNIMMQLREDSGLFLGLLNCTITPLTRKYVLKRFSESLGALDFANFFHTS